MAILRIAPRPGACSLCAEPFPVSPRETLRAAARADRLRRASGAPDEDPSGPSSEVPTTSGGTTSY
jgi:hypothetical protein